MGKPDLFAKRTFASRTESITGGAVSWKDAPEMDLEHVQSDGILVVHDPVKLGKLPAPWNLITESDEILLEFKMQGDHVDRPAISRTLVRRQVRETQRLDEALARRTSWLGSQTLWLVSGYVPEWAEQRYRPERVHPGCYRWANEHFTAWWIASNELPLQDELMPFLITRTGGAMEEFLFWMTQKKSWRLVQDLVDSLRMLPVELRNFLDDYITNQYRYKDRETKLNVISWFLFFLESDPQFVNEMAKKAAQIEAEAVVLREARNAVKRTLQLRKLDVRPEHIAQIDACMDLDTLHRWHDGAITSASVDEALAVN